MAEATIEDLRKLLQEYTVINDGYLECLDRKDTKILQQDKVIEDLQNKLSMLMNSEVPEKVEVSQ